MRDVFARLEMRDDVEQPGEGERDDADLRQGGQGVELAADRSIVSTR
jgi:hypothetical protein